MLKQVGAPEEYLYLGEGPVTADALKPKEEPPPGKINPEIYWAREWATYERHREELERRSMGQFALIYGTELVGVFDKWEEASDEGCRRFGLEKCLIQEIGDPVYVILPTLF
jgi:hypothetical protein